jgi:hypothetical protein
MKNSLLFLFVIIIATVSLFVACNKNEESKMLDVAITKTNLPEIISNMKSENLLTSEDILSFNNALNRIGANNPDTLIGMTPREIFGIQDSFIKVNQYEMINITATRIAMNMNFDIKFLGLKPLFDSVNKQQGNTIFYEFKNNSEKTIKKIEGLLQFYNRQNQIIKQFQIETTELLQPNTTLQFYKNFAHNENEPRDTIIRNHFAELIVRWQPSKLEFSDGIKIELNEK